MARSAGTRLAAVSLAGYVSIWNVPATGAASPIITGGLNALIQADATPGDLPCAERYRRWSVRDRRHVVYRTHGAKHDRITRRYDAAVTIAWDGGYLSGPAAEHAARADTEARSWCARGSGLWPGWWLGLGGGAGLSGGKAFVWRNISSAYHGDFLCIIDDLFSSLFLFKFEHIATFFPRHLYDT